MRSPFNSLAFGSALAFALCASAALIGSGPAAECADRTTLAEHYIGVNNDVKVESVYCSNNLQSDAGAGTASELESDLTRRQNDVCGAACTTFCFTPSGGGPDPNDCNVIQDALLYDSQNVGQLFTLDPAANTSQIVMTYNTCQTYILDQTNSSLTYCRSDWASLVYYIAWNCQSTQNAHGGLCVASDGRWYIQVQHT
ncbi:hypothetical protein CERSUDRAFT_109882 [Gelatoporia subvermispora B]|uniref:Uncharacterized protein n=1 Tax=Ceriporiopsis subvermispora (strain B) TaxID=914234 RepID=M2RS65_CERS8|nr:hypothetical protein CERSUDRAFT_109882 [Gelatoporia subvermispora B]